MSFHFPNGFDLYLEDDIPDSPYKPSLPQRPRTAMEKLTARHSFQNFQNFRKYVPDVQLPTSYTLKRTDAYDFEDSFRLIKHNEKVILPELFLFFPSYEQVKSFQCTYRITVANLPDLVEGAIDFKFETGHLSEEES